MTKPLLDYAVFDALKSALSAGDPACLDSFASSVLGYGFSPNEGQGPAFILLCNPHAKTYLSELIASQLPDAQLAIDALNLPVSVSDSADQKELQHSISIPEKPAAKPAHPDEKLEEWVQISLGQTLRQVVLQDQRKVILPAYLLRYTPFTSPNLIILRAALSQIHFLHQSGAQAEDDFERRSVTARMNEIQRWSSFSRTSIYRLLHEDPRSRWLVRVENRGSFQNDQGQQISLPNQYTLEPLQLTPGDATDLEIYLHAHRADWETVDDCLLALPRTDRRQILTYPYRTPQPDDRAEPASVLEILQGVFGSFELTATRLTLSDKIRDHLIGTDFVAAPWYLLRRLLPVYGASIVTAYLMCQPLLFKHNGVERDTFWLPGGAEALMAWTDDRSFGKYFPKANAKGRGRPATAKGSSDATWRKNKREMLADFFLRVKTRRDGEGAMHWQIKVWEMPILPEDARLMDSVHALLADLIREGHLDKLLTLLDQIEPAHDAPAGQSVLDRIYQNPPAIETQTVLTCLARELISDFETPEDPPISNFETPVERIISLFETSEAALISKNATPVIAFISDLETHLKILEKIKDSIKIIKNPISSQDSETNKVTNTKTTEADWNLTKILAPVSLNFRKEILETPERIMLFKAWLIHSSLNSRVNQPLNLAINKTLQGTTAPEGAAKRLAALSLAGLIQLLNNALDQFGDWGYRQGGEDQAFARDLELLLVGEKPQTRPLLIQRLLDLVN
jgi:hypothetical protein